MVGPLAVTAGVWRPEPPFEGTIETRQFTIDVQHGEDDRFTLDVPPEAGCILIAVWTKVIDATGYTWTLFNIVDVPNETVTFGDDIRDFADARERHRREWKWIKEPSLLDKLWNPPTVYARAVHDAIRTEQPAVTLEIGEILEAHGPEGYHALLAPSLLRGRQA